MKKSYKDNNATSSPNVGFAGTDLQQAISTLESQNRELAKQTLYSTALARTKNMFRDIPFMPTLEDVAKDKDTESPAPSASSIVPCQYFPKTIVDGVDIAKTLRDIAVVTGALRDNTHVTNLDRVQHWSAERLAHFIVNDSKKIISGSGDAVAEITEWLKSKIE